MPASQQLGPQPLTDASSETGPGQTPLTPKALQQRAVRPQPSGAARVKRQPSGKAGEQAAAATPKRQRPDSPNAEEQAPTGSEMALAALAAALPQLRYLSGYIGDRKQLLVNTSADPACSGLLCRTCRACSAVTPATQQLHSCAHGTCCRCTGYAYRWIRMQCRLYRI